MVIVAIIIALLIAFVAWDYWRISQPLTPVQMNELAVKRRLRLIYEYFSFTRTRLPLDTTFKSSMRSDGSFHWVDYPLDMALSIAASHLKCKKHEWVEFLFCADHRVVGMWCNKGPDSTMVAPSIGTDDLCGIASSKQADLVIRAHNHPNPHSVNVSLLGPSDQDLRSSQYFAEVINSHGMNFLDAVCERGRWLVYGESYVRSFFPYDRIRTEIADRNWGGGAQVRKLHRELRRHLHRPGYSIPASRVPRREVA